MPLKSDLRFSPPRTCCEEPETNRALPPLRQATAAILPLVYVGVALAADWTPPLPDPANPVNYVVWFNKTLELPENENAWFGYMEAHDALEDLLPDKDKASGISTAMARIWADRARTEEWLLKARGAMAKFRAASRKPDCVIKLNISSRSDDPRITNSLLLFEIPGLGAHRQLSKSMAAAAYADWSKGRDRTLRNNAIALIRSGDHMSGTPLLLTNLLGVADRTLGYHMIRKALSMSDDPSRFAEKMTDQLKKSDPPMRPFSHQLRGERLFQLDLCQRIFVPDGAGKWRVHKPILQLYEQFAGTSSPDLEKELVKCGYDDSVRMAETFFSKADEWCNLPFPEAGDLANELESLRKRTIRNPLAGFLPSLERSRLIHERCRAERHGTHLVVLILNHKAKTGTLPHSLDDIDAPELSQLRLDPFSGRDLIYKPTGDSFVLYTVSQNMRDDGGKHDRGWKAPSGAGDGNGDFVFWPYEE